MATVAFELDALITLVNNTVGQTPISELRQLYEEFQRTTRTNRSVGHAMGLANAYLDGAEVVFLYEPEGEGLMGEGHVLGVFIAFEERIRPPGGAPDQDDMTILYDWDANTFRIMSPDEFWNARLETETVTRGDEHVRFDRGEFGAEFANQWRVEPPVIQRLYEAMHVANSLRSARAVLRRINEAANQHGVETVAPENAEGRELLYINTGDTYSGTVGYDVQENAFILTTWGGWVEEVERQNAPTEDVCVSCGQQFAVEELEYDEDGTGATCRNCRETHSVWYPNRWNNPPLIALLRSVEGHEVAVHFWDDRPVGVAFSVPLGHGAFSARQIKGRSSDEPYVEDYAELVRRFSGPNAAHEQIVAHTGAQPVTLEREMIQRLRVAMDAFTSDMRPATVFLTAPPPLWRCPEVSHVTWHEERGEAAVEAYVNDPAYREPYAYSVWSARSPEVEELIQDGFIRWKDNESVREYLKSIGTCR